MYVGLGCAASEPQTALPRAAVPELASARELAPDYAARVDSAFQAAKAETSDQGRAQQLRRAQLLAIAARAEAERVAILRQLPAYESRIEQAVLARWQSERARIALERARVLEQAAEAQRGEARWAFEKLAAGAVSAQDRERVWEFLVQRAQALCAAARVLGAPARELDAADLQLTAARTAKLSERIEQARRALYMAERDLGIARASHEPSAAERRDLRDRLQERGLVLRDDRFMVELGSVGSPQLSRRVAQLNELLVAFPHGPIQLKCAERAACTANWFAPGLRERVRIEAGPGEPGAEVVRVVLPAYAEGPTQP
jgi:hypothetical protein